MNSPRKFQLKSINNIDISSNVYNGKRPAQAALKAFNWYCRKTGEKSCNANFIIEELGIRKKFQYIGIRKLLEKPKEIKRNNDVYLVRYETIVHKSKNIYENEIIN